MKWICLLLTALVMTACGGDRDEEAGTVGKQIAEDLNRNLDEARAVEAELEATRNRLDESLEQAEGSDPDP